VCAAFAFERVYRPEQDYLSGNGMPGMPDDTSDVSCKKTAEPIEPFVLWARVGSRNHVLDGGPDPPMRWSNF